MTYSTLKPEQGWTKHFSEEKWNQSEADLAELEAAVWINQRLIRWIRPSWHTDPPPSVAMAHNYYASGIYIRREAMQADPYGMSDDGSAPGSSIIAIAEKLVDKIIADGGPVVRGEHLPAVGDDEPRRGAVHLTR